MLDLIQRKDPTLNDAIEELNRPLALCDNNISLAWNSLSQDETDWIDTELDRCIDPETGMRYYLENYHCIEDEHGIVHTLYPFWDHQEMVYEAVQEEFEKYGSCLIIVLKPRQTGISTWTAASMFHRTIFTPQMRTLLIAQDGDTSNNLYKMCEGAYQNLPWWMRPDRQYKREGDYIEFQEPDERIRLTRPGLGSRLTINHAQRLTGVSIGRTVRSFHGSEASRWPNPEVFTGDIEPTMNAEDEYGVLESTGWGRNGFFYNHWVGSVAGDTDWRALFIPVYKVRKYIDLGHKYVKRAGGFELNVEERKFTERVSREEKYDIPDEFWAWRRAKVRASVRSTGAPWAHYESYPITPEEAFQSSGVCAFDRTALSEQMTRNVCKPIFAGEIMLESLPARLINTANIREVGDDEILHPRKSENNQLKRDRLYIWAMPEPGGKYYIALDSALGVPDGDYSVAQVIKIGLGTDPDEQVAEWWGHVPPKEFANIGAALGIFYADSDGPAEVAVEYKGPGITTGDAMFEMDYPTLYRGRHKDRFQNQLRAFVHWDTNTKTRDLIIAETNSGLLADNIIIHSRDLIDEMYDFGSLDSGVRFEGQGNHDDGILAFMICLYCAREAVAGLKTSSKTVGSAPCGRHDINQYAAVDECGRQRGQYNTQGEAAEVIKDKKGWKVRPVLICQANTLYSPIYDARGAEHKLRFKHGLSSSEILPDVVHPYRSAMQTEMEGSVSADDDW